MYYIVKVLLFVIICCFSVVNLKKYKSESNSYFEVMKKVYGNSYSNTCLASIEGNNGYIPSVSSSKQVPMFVLAVGLEGSGHHLWSTILGKGVSDCFWVNGRHYLRDVGDGVPRTSVSDLKDGLKEQFSLRKKAGNPPCRFIYNSGFSFFLIAVIKNIEDSFPTGSIRKTGRLFMHPDIVNLRRLHEGGFISLKLLILNRDPVDTILSALRRNFFNSGVVR